VGAYGVSFGALAAASGLSVAQACALSVLVFTGASQFALVGVLAAGGGAVSATLTALLLGSRNLLYGLRLAPLLGLSGAARAVGAQLVIDESAGMAVSRTARPAVRLAFWSTGLAVYVLWNAATLLGAAGAGALGEPAALGLDAAVPAAFLGLLWPRLRERVNRPVALAAALVALGVGLVAPPGLPVLAAGLVAVAAGIRTSGRVP
jgi:predicted branched-subunit amino acid permease